MINLKRIDLKNKHHVQYSDVPSALRSIPNGPDLPGTESDVNMEYSSDSEHSDMTVVVGNDTYKPENNDQPVPLTQAELANLTEDLKF